MEALAVFGNTQFLLVFSSYLVNSFGGTSPEISLTTPGRACPSFHFPRLSHPTRVFLCVCAPPPKKKKSTLNIARSRLAQLCGCTDAALNDCAVVDDSNSDE